MCTRFGCLPSVLMQEDAGLLHLLMLEELGKTVESEGGE